MFSIWCRWRNKKNTHFVVVARGRLLVVHPSESALFWACFFSSRPFLHPSIPSVWVCLLTRRISVVRLPTTQCQERRSGRTDQQASKQASKAASIHWPLGGSVCPSVRPSDAIDLASLFYLPTYLLAAVDTLDRPKNASSSSIVFTTWQYNFCTDKPD